MTQTQDATRDELIATCIDNLSKASKAHSDRLAAVEQKLDKIFKVLDTAVERFAAVTQSPMLAQLFSGLQQPKK